MTFSQLSNVNNSSLGLWRIRCTVLIFCLDQRCDVIKCNSFHFWQTKKMFAFWKRSNILTSLWQNTPRGCLVRRRRLFQKLRRKELLKPNYESFKGIKPKQEKIRGQRGTLPDQALGYVKFGKVIFRRPFATEVWIQDVHIKATSICCLKYHSKFCL